MNFVNLVGGEHPGLINHHICRSQGKLTSELGLMSEEGVAYRAA